MLRRSNYFNLEKNLISQPLKECLEIILYFIKQQLGVSSAIVSLLSRIVNVLSESEVSANFLHQLSFPALASDSLCINKPAYRKPMYTVHHTERSIYYRKSVLFLGRRMFHVRLSRCSTELRYYSVHPVHILMFTYWFTNNIHTIFYKQVLQSVSPLIFAIGRTKYISNYIITL